MSDGSWGAGLGPHGRRRERRGHARPPGIQAGTFISDARSPSQSDFPCVARPIWNEFLLLPFLFISCLLLKRPGGRVRK